MSVYKSVPLEEIPAKVSVGAYRSIQIQHGCAPAPNGHGIPLAWKP